MVKFIVKTVNDTPEKMKGELVAPTTHYFFDIAEYATKLSQTSADLLIILWRS